MSQGHGLDQIAQTMVSLGDTGTLSELYSHLISDAASNAWPAFLAAVEALPNGVTNDDPFGRALMVELKEDPKLELSLQLRINRAENEALDAVVKSQKRKHALLLSGLIILVILEAVVTAYLVWMIAVSSTTYQYLLPLSGLLAFSIILVCQGVRRSGSLQHALRVAQRKQDDAIALAEELLNSSTSMAAAASAGSGL
jgi:hypothetical protein